MANDQPPRPSRRGFLKAGAGMGVKLSPDPMPEQAGQVFIGTFEKEHDLLAATGAARTSGADIVDAYTPYPIHGLDEAMGIEPSRLPTYAFAFAVMIPVSPL